MADSATSEVDPYGFERPNNFNIAVHEEFMSHYIRVMAHRSSRWSKFMDGKKRVSKSAKLKRFARKGIPLEHRPLVWMYVSGAEKCRRASPDLYRQLVDGPHDEQLVDIVTTDVPRTFPDNIHFKAASADRAAKHRALFNVLIAVAHKNQRIGYCQGMNFIAGLLLLIVKDEERTFWLLDTLINKILPDYFAQDMLGLKTECEVLGELVRAKSPVVYELFKRCNCPWSLITTRWFICLFIDVVPTETVLRIWDCLFFEGSKILLRVGLSLVLKHSEAIIRCRSLPELMDFFRTISTTAAVVNCHEFMQSIFTDLDPFPRSRIELLRTECRRRVIADDSKQ